MIQLIASDYDGTLARNDKTVSDYTRRVIAEYLRRGGIFCVATGRMTEGILSQLARLGLAEYDLPLISFQGALLSLSRSGKVLRQSYLDADTAVEIIEYCRTNGIHAQTYADGCVVVEKSHPHLDGYCAMNEVACMRVRSLSDFVRRHPVYKILTWLDESVLDRYKSEAEKLFGGNCKVCQASRHFLEYFSLDAGKDAALRAAAELYGVKIPNTAAFGDQYNDLDLLRAAGVGIAVANAVEPLLRAADIITESNENDGVAQAITRMIGYEEEV